MKVFLSHDSCGSWPPEVAKVYPHVFLSRDNWNDYGYETKFGATLALTPETTVELGSVKIGMIGHTGERNMRDILPVASDGLDTSYFSLGQNVEFYDRLLELSPEMRADYAASLRDIPLLDLSADQLRQDPVFEISLLRTSGAREALDKAAALFDAETHERRMEVFTFETTLDGADAPHRLTFDFAAGAGLPHRINVLVGVNGVGKTQLMARLAMVLSQFERSENREVRVASRGSLKDVGTLTPSPSFYSVIAVSFSAFDDFQLPDAVETADYRYAYCGLRNLDETISNEASLATRIPGLIERMSDDRRLLAVDLLSRAIDRPVTLADLGASAFYRTLSAGQRIVANIVAELALNLRERSLILLDEPETHLHPQLVSRLLSVLNDLLEGFDSAAVIATHTPVVVQQVLARRVHVVRRVDSIPLVTQPLIETFGENLTEIVRVVFDAIESDRGYQEVLDKLLEAHDGSVGAVEALFGERLGFNARTYLRSRGAPG